jgi:mono/diheme cytochrome c family protein
VKDRHPHRSAVARWASLPIILSLAGLVACGGGDRTSDTTVAGGGAPAAGGRGEQLYARCITCHQADGQGTPGAFPPLAGAEYVTTANVEVPIRIVIHGMEGPITVKGVDYNGAMPPYGVGIEMSDAEVADVLTYVRSSWGNSASAITADDVARVRAAPRAATGAVTAAELKPLM